MQFRCDPDATKMSFRCNLDVLQIQFSNRDGAFTTYTGGWVGGKLESNAKLNSKLRLKLYLKLELSSAVSINIDSFDCRAFFNFRVFTNVLNFPEGFSLILYCRD